MKDAHWKEGEGPVEVEVVDPLGDKLDVMTEKGENGVTNVSYVPKMPGLHRFGRKFKLSSIRLKRSYFLFF